MAQICLLLGALGFIILYAIVVGTVMDAFNEWQHRKIMKHFDAIKNATIQLAETRKRIEDLKQEVQNNE